MQVTATHLTNWSDKRVAQEVLPVLIRRLISSTSQLKALSVPGGDSVNTPGWDGVVDAAQGNAWVPTGLSYWEFGTSRKPSDKATEDFKKRLEQVSSAEAKAASFVFLTSRRWPKKKAWCEKMSSQGCWREVLVWDADDLEAWLETSAAVTLWLGSQLGIAGHGIEAIEHYWEHWRCQSDPAMTAEALFVGRERSRADLQRCLEEKDTLIAVMSDSQSEAVAFVCAFLTESGYSQRSACVTSEEGWHFFDSNAGIDIVVVTDNQLGTYRAPRAGQTLIVPLAFGDQSFNLAGLASKTINCKIIELRRLKPEEFEQSLLELGLASADAAKYTRTMGRSWTVFRRWYALNPAIRKPTWLDATNTSTLQLLTLVGAWNGASEGDRACVSQIADRSYEDIESELLELASLDDSPVLKIGSLWKAKAPLELLYLISPKLTGAILSRFFLVALAVFEEPDPVLELEEEKRWMASIYGKVRDHSGVVLDAMADSIAKLGYFSEASDGGFEVGKDVRSFVRQVLEGADESRWLSVSQYLPSFCEAAPDEFIAAVRDSIKSTDRPVVRLITETQASGAFSRCWHATLLWALETAAWYPLRLPRVADALAKLSEIEIKGNWSNTPFNSLVSLFRPWYPQTAAPIELRLRVVRDVVKQHASTGWRLLVSLVPNHFDSASPNAKPHWRDDNAGAGEGVTNQEYREFLLSIGDLLVQQADGYAQRIAELVPLIDQLDRKFGNSIIGLIEASTSYDDESKELIRSSVRKFLNWQNSFNRDGEQGERYYANLLRPMFDSLAPDDLVIRHSWIFANGWVDLPDGEHEDYREADRVKSELRLTVVQEVYAKNGWEGITRLADRCSDPVLVGREIVNDPFDSVYLVNWLCQRYIQSRESYFDPLIFGVLTATPKSEIFPFLNKCLHQLYKIGASASVRAGFLANSPQSMSLWKLVEKQGLDVEHEFWSVVRPFHVESKNNELLFCIDRLIVAERPRTAMMAVGGRFDDLSVDSLVQILRCLASGQEADASFPQSWSISSLFQILNTSGELARAEMAGLEFTYHEILRRGKYGTPNLMSEALSNPESFMELIDLAYGSSRPDDAALASNRDAIAETARSFLRNARGVPGLRPDGCVNADSFFSWIEIVRHLSEEKGILEITDITIGTWLSNWPCKNGLKCWPEPMIAELLDQENCADLRRGFRTGVYNARGTSSRLPYDGGDQERGIADIFRGHAIEWGNSRPNLAEMIEGLAKSYEREARDHDESGLWTQES